MKLTVRYLGHPEQPIVGDLFEAPDHRIYFQYDPSWRERRIELSPIYLPASTEGSVPTPSPEFSPLFGLFDDSLPDWWGQQLLKKFFDEKGIRWNRVGALQKLAAQGSYGLGALGYEPDEAPGDFRCEISIEVAALADAARGIVEGEAQSTLPELIRSGISAGGAQPKALVHFSEDLGTAWPGGITPPEGTSPWMIKFQLDPEVHTTREEHAFHLMARAAGIDAARTSILTDDRGRAHFLARRFDRSGGEKIHLHSYSGLTHIRPGDGLDYGSLMNLTRTLCRSEEAAEEVFRRAVFNVAAGNEDDHGRNHAFLMGSTGDWSLSPAYDLTFATHPLATNLRSASVMGKFASVSRTDLMDLAKDQGVRLAEQTIDQVIDAIRRWPEFASAAELPEFHAGRLGDEFPAASW